MSRDAANKVQMFKIPFPFFKKLDIPYQTCLQTDFKSQFTKGPMASIRA